MNEHLVGLCFEFKDGRDLQYYHPVDLGAFNRKKTKLVYYFDVITGYSTTPVAIPVEEVQSISIYDVCEKCLKPDVGDVCSKICNTSIEMSVEEAIKAIRYALESCTDGYEEAIEGLEVLVSRLKDVIV